MAMEELNEGQALAAVQQLMYAFQGIGKLHGVLTHYDRIKDELPELDAQKAAVEKEIEESKRSMENLRAHHNDSIKEMAEEFKARKSECTQEHAKHAAELSKAIEELKQRKLAAEDAAAGAEAAAKRRINDALAEAVAVRARADEDVVVIEAKVAEKTAEYNALVEKLNAFKASIGQVGGGEWGPITSSTN
jgi:chromosome segregation ATPase